MRTRNGIPKRSGTMAVLLLVLVAAAGFSQTEGVPGTATQAGVRVRQEPTLQGKQTGSLSKGERVTVLGRTAETTKVDGVEAYWLRIRTGAGLEEWAYGLFFDVETGSLPAPSARTAGLAYVDRHGDAGIAGACAIALSPHGTHLYVAASDAGRVTWFRRE